MLEFKTPQIEDKAWVDQCFKHLKTMNCDYTFGNMFVWSTEYSTKICRFKDFLFAVGVWARKPILASLSEKVILKKPLRKLSNMLRLMILCHAFTVLPKLMLRC